MNLDLRPTSLRPTSLRPTSLRPTSLRPTSLRPRLIPMKTYKNYELNREQDQQIAIGAIHIWQTTQAFKDQSNKVAYARVCIKLQTWY